MASDYPVHVEVTSPKHFERVQLLLRVILAIVLGWVGVTAGWLVWMLYGALPLIAAIAISARGSERYMAEVAPRVWRVLAWLLSLSAYMMLLVDRLPIDGDASTRVEIRFTGRPTVRTALMRLLTSVPSGFVLMVLWFVSSVLWLLAAALVLLGAPMPGSLLAFQRGVLRWQARLVAYHASFVDEYPPFAFDDHDDELTAVRRAP